MADSAVVEALQPRTIPRRPRPRRHRRRQAWAVPMSAADNFLTNHRTLALFLISVAGLFLELLLIRWITTEIRIFAYLQNTVLVVCFLGLGMGCWSSRKPFALRHILVPLAALVVLLSVPITRALLASITNLFSGFSDLVIWGMTVKSGWGCLRACGPRLDADDDRHGPDLGHIPSGWPSARSPDVRSPADH